MISIIAVIGTNKELGCNNQLLWHLPGDLKHFKEITSGHPVIMGRKTFESIGSPLPNRINIVITRDKECKIPECEVINDIQNIIDQYKNSKEEVFIIGGGKIYEQFLPFADKLYLTLVEDSPVADTYFPDYSEFQKIIAESEVQTENGINYKFIEITR